MATPVAKLALDTRAWGPASCEKCPDDVEDVILMSDMTIVCADCMTPMVGESFDHLGELFTSASPYVAPGKTKG
jgi:hypothetical protein